jgi:hypothetical protein
MRGRVVLGALVGVLLPVPLLLVLGSVWTHGVRPPMPEDARYSPVLSSEARDRLLTYHRRCLKASDCEPPLACMGDARFFTSYCTDSQCVTDAQCPEGSVCHPLSTFKGSPLVRFCVPMGPRQEGEPCLDLPSQRASACGRGLICGGKGLGWCGRPCHKGEPTSCPEGFFCADVRPEPICMPSCERLGCPEGQQCVLDDEGASACAVVHGTECQQSPCPDSQECRTYFSSRHPGEAWMQCIHPCDPKNPMCPDGLVCARHRCQQPCEPWKPGTCGTGYRCEQRKPDAPWICEPDWDE